MSIPHAEFIQCSSFFPTDSWRFGDPSYTSGLTQSICALACTHAIKHLRFRLRVNMCAHTHTHFQNYTLLLCTATIGCFGNNRAMQTGNVVTIDLGYNQVSGINDNKTEA